MALRLCGICNVDQPVIPSSMTFRDVWHCGAPCSPNGRCGFCWFVRPTASEPVHLGGWYYLGQWYCCSSCRHSAGDRSTCNDACGCSRFTRHHYLLRRHRAHMRVMVGLFRRRRLMRALDDALPELVSLALDPTLDFSSDNVAEDSVDLRAEVTGLRGENGDMRNFVAATASVVRERALMTDLERSRMMSEDLRSAMCR
jgi:hypothetical protein